MTAEAYRNAELQLLNTGDVIIMNCTFDKVIVSPFGSTTASVFDRCSFENVYNAYTIKDVYSPDLTVQNCQFKNCSGGIYLEGDASKNNITITGNRFTDMDLYALQDKVNTRGLIQFSSSGDYSNA